MPLVDTHFMAALKASYAACEVLGLMSDSDLVAELKVLLHTQADLFSHILEGKHFGTNNLNNFFAYIEEIKEEVSKIKEER